MSTVSISVGGRFLKLPDNYGITWEQNHPAFFDLLDLGEHTFPIEIPAVDSNPDILAYSNAMQLLEPQLEFEACVIYIGDNPFKYGKLVIDRITEDSFSGIIKTGLSALPVLDKKLSELELGGIRDIGDNTDDVVAHAKAVAEDTYPNKDYTFYPVYNPDFYGTGDGSVNPGFSGFLNVWDATLGTPTFAKNSIPSSQANEIFVNSYALVPFIYYKYLINQILAEENLTADGSFISDAKTDKLTLYSNYDLARFEPKYNIKAVAVDEEHLFGFARIPCPDDHDNGYDPDDAWQSGPLPYYVIGTAGLHEVKVKFTPLYPGEPYNVRIKIVRNSQTLILWQSEFAPLNFTTSHPFYLNFSFWASEAMIGQNVEVLVNVIDASDNNINFQNAASSPDDTWVQISTPTKSKLNVYALEINLQNHVPDMTCREFLTRIKNQWCLSTKLDPNTNKLYLNYTDDLFSQTAKEAKEIPGFEFISDKSSAVKLLGFEWPGDDDAVKTETNFFVPDADNILGEYNTYSDIPAPTEEGKYALVKNLNKWYRSTYNQTFTWSPYSDNYYNYVFDADADNEILCKAPPLMMYRTKSVDVFDGKLIVPYIRQQGSSPLFGLEVKPSELRSCYYHGFYDNENAVDYPFASPHALTAAGSSTEAIIPIIFIEGNLLDKFTRWIGNILNAPGYYIKSFDFNMLDLHSLHVIDLLTFRSMRFFMRKLTHNFKPEQKIASEAEIIRI